MRQIVNEELVSFISEVNGAYKRICEDPKYSDLFFEIYKPSIRLYTDDGLTARFWEEGIEFYPEEKK